MVVASADSSPKFALPLRMVLFFGADPAQTRRRPGADPATDPDCLVHMRMKEISFNHAWNSREESSVLNETQKSEDELKIGILVIEEEPM